MGRWAIPIDVRFWRKVRKLDPDMCWPWLGARCGKDGAYGQTSIKGHKLMAHRVAWQLAHPGESIPDGLDVCHTCDNGLCVNPAHLFIGSARDNMQDKLRKGRANMPKGEQTANHKLTARKVRDIRLRAAQGESRRDLGRDYGVSAVAITMLVNRKTWKHVP